MNSQQSTAKDKQMSSAIKFCVSWKAIIAIVFGFYCAVVLTIYIQLSSLSDGTRPFLGENRTGTPGFVRKSVPRPHQDEHMDGLPKVRKPDESISEMRERFDRQGIDLPKPVISLKSVSMNPHKHKHKSENGSGGEEGVQPMKRGSQSSSSLGISSQTSNGLSTLLSWSSSSSSKTVVSGVVEETYRNLLKEMETKLSKHEKIKGLKSCRWKSTFQSYSTDSYAACRDIKGPIYFYNPLPDNERIICGTKLPPKKVISIDTLCQEPAAGRLFPVIPDPTGKGMPPTVTRFPGRKTAKSVPFKDCDIPCDQAGSFSIVTKRYIDGTPWEITMSMEGPEYYSNLRIDPDGWKRDKYWSTTSFDSEIPLPYYSKAEYEIRDQKPVDFEDSIHGGVFMAKNCGSHSNRERVVTELQKLAKTSTTFRVESVSSCLKNAEIPPGSKREDKVSIMKRYLFYFAFENQIVPDYITEKLWGPFTAGTVPVYLGAPNVKEHVPKNSIIHVADFKDTKELFEYLEKVASNKTLYESYHEWRVTPQPEFEEKLNLTYTHGTCRTCRWGYARMHGLGWNHPQQRVEDLHIPRKTCLDPWSGLLKHPVVETWQNPTSLAALSSKRQSSSWQTTEVCLEGTLAEDRTSIGPSADRLEIRRTVRQVDGVIDIEINALADDVSEAQLGLETKLESSSAKFTQVKAGHVRFQDIKSRVTMLVSPSSVAVSSEANKLLVSISREALPFRIRLVSEDVDTFHKDGDKEESFFGKLMATDFEFPVEAFFSG